MMKCLVMQAPGELCLTECEKPQCLPEQAIIRMEYCGICGSDLSAYAGNNPTVRYPIHGVGHEGIGVIEEIGENDAGLAPGDRVALEPYIPCMHCRMCRAGRYNNCEHIAVAGCHTDGMMAEYVRFPVRLLHRLPAGLDPVKAALAEPLTIGLHAAARARVQPGEFCVITGAGPIGLLAALGVKYHGATPILVDVMDDRLQFAQECGVEYTCNSTKTDLVAYLHEVTGDLPQALLECTGSPFVLGSMHDYVAYGGRIATVGWPKGPVTINTIRCQQKELDICPSRNSNRQFPTALAMIAAGSIPAEKIISGVVPLEKTEETLVDIRKNPGRYIKVIVKI